MRDLSSTEQVLSNAIQTADILNADEADEIIERLDTIMAALTAVAAKVKEQREKP